MTAIEALEDICEKIQSGNYDVQEIYEECQKKISELEVENHDKADE
jgi:uncharacterized protein YutE (UPF0331/DUF86 family)